MKSRPWDVVRPAICRAVVGQRFTQEYIDDYIMAMEDAGATCFYFSYGTSDKQAFQGGFTVVYAESLKEAQQKYFEVHPAGTDAYCDHYTEEQWKETRMSIGHETNLGHGCWELIE